MADCNDTIRELQRYLDHELPDNVQHVVEKHLNGCVDCLQAFDFHAELKLVIAQKCSTEPMPPGLLSRIESCFGVDIDGDGRIG
jgi:anti-sigma factor (TIGR02949 family)